jgi:hypothetical protein
MLHGPGDWPPLARSADGRQAAFVVDERVTPGAYTVGLAGGETQTIGVEGRARFYRSAGGDGTGGRALFRWAGASGLCPRA